MTRAELKIAVKRQYGWLEHHKQHDDLKGILETRQRILELEGQLHERRIDVRRRMHLLMPRITKPVTELLGTPVTTS